MLNKYNRRFKEMNAKFYDISDTPEEEKYDLFVINKSGGKEYKEEDFGKILIYLNYIFPKPTKYEKINRIDGIYFFETAINESKIIKLKYDNIQKNNYLSLNKKEGKKSELFKIEYQNDDGSYTIKSLISKTFLGVTENIEYYNTNEKSISLEFYPNVDEKKQKWYFLTNNKDFYYITSANELCSLDISSDDANDDSKIKCYYANGTKSQMFKLKMYNN